MVEVGFAGRSCLQRAHDNMNCLTMDDEEKLKFAVRLLNCYFEKTGQKQHKCTKDMSIRQCTSGMNEATHIMVNSYLQHAENLCRYLQNDAFVARTENTISNLFTATHDTISHLGSLVSTAEILNQNLTDAVRLQKAVHEGVTGLRTQQEVLIKTQSERFDTLANLSSSIQTDVEHSLTVSRALAAAQQDLASAQRSMASGLMDALQELQSNSTHLVLLLGEAMTGQRELLALQGEIATSVASVKVAQQTAEKSLNALVLQTQAIDGHLSDSLRKGDQLLALQREAEQGMLSLKATQSQSFRRAEEALSSLAKSSEDAAQHIRVQNEIYERTTHEIFDSLHLIREGNVRILNNFFDIKAALFYGLTSLVAFLATASVHTQGARFWIYTVLSLNYALERLVGLLVQFGYLADVEPFVFLLRRLCLLVCGLCLFLSVCRYRNYEKLNYRSIATLTRDVRSLERQLTNLEAYIRTLPLALVPPPPNEEDVTESRGKAQAERSLLLPEEETARLRSPKHDD
ncbi:hypothetical protein PAPYR_3378 [Paratrimastix pyriformis]|uniref:Protein GAMETE EXPRESSED 1 n=1 Tax=Paratrimastix pyriformis TaxID=342808 RepID=A0ABQ8UMH1_9EUKA|nr:hypothetical protein PAPYR_3378 [Paratrimastix pyriformis]